MREIKFGKFIKCFYVQFHIEKQQKNLKIVCGENTIRVKLKST